ncbi:cytochrome d ubiquinol oxidase subunit II [Phenylobacterium montanum]|uniref:Cytochrome d ubiquinol oxidase subunit II n=1 Tax=Phenylobacterium montanum TaxID=2823693 RepID=A0A975IUU8_9CAUL|nr:cytochrome d ubiquinol oxidase subunit II [Caulobacter sp. S6]QUD88125.1 cytochrome d ubiquinol oxidase subunit II [Caulobacter sp. S6]
MSGETWLVGVWAGLIAFAVFAYVVMDGFDLGIGVLFPFLGAHSQRGRAMNAIAPVWDGNETWLVLGGGGLFAAFPLAYAILMPAVYAPLIAMLLGLVFRGVAFEFRWRTLRGRWAWDVAFSAGSTLAAVSQGMILGAILQGVKVSGRAYAGGWWDWLTPFSVLTGLSVAAGYALLGACWLILKSEGELQDRAWRLAWRCAAATMAAIAAVSAATPLLKGDYWRRWFAFPNVLATAQVPLLVLIVAVGLFVSLRRKAELWPFPLALALFALGYAGLAISLYPYLVPGEVTLWQAAAPTASLGFMLAGAAVLIPVILAYTSYAYWVFRGKTGAEGYH